MLRVVDFLFATLAKDIVTSGDTPPDLEIALLMEASFRWGDLEDCFLPAAPLRIGECETGLDGKGDAADEVNIIAKSPLPEERCDKAWDLDHPMIDCFLEVDNTVYKDPTGCPGKWWPLAALYVIMLCCVLPNSNSEIPGTIVTD